MNPNTDRNAHSGNTPWARPAASDGLQPDMIEKSRQRCIAYGLRENDLPDFSLAGRGDLAQILEQNHVLHTYARPVMETLYDQIVNTHSMVILTDPTGLVMHSLGDDDFLAKVEKIAIRPGVTWSEQSKGTNAIGTTIEEQAPTQVHGSEHYLHANHFITCSAAPIFDHQGKLLGVLDVTGDQRSYHMHTMALVRMSAQMIENQLFSATFRNAITLHFHSRAELIGTLVEGIASFTPGGRFLSANRAGLTLLGLPLAALQSHTVSSLFGLPVSALFDHYRAAAPAFLKLCLHNGVTVLAKAELRLESAIFQHTADAARAPRDLDTAVPESKAPELPAPALRASVAAAPKSRTSLCALNTGDPKITAAIERIGKVQGRDIPILLMGETGTGKDLFAQAIHHDSPQSAGPFVAVNCASIPETLIESELFGYEEGAFTGARKNGGIGKILQANGGSLFLDEIGDMPLSLQARLLRVLQERMVTPLGSTKSIPVTFALTCATNRNLREMITRGAFREDLYYRLNGLVVKLPALRERTDLETVVHQVMRESGGARHTFSTEVMQLFRMHQWPGNLRQLDNLLRTAMAMAGDEREIRREHLSDDFLEDAENADWSNGRTGDEEEVERIRLSKAPPGASGKKLDDLEMSMIQRTLDAHGGNVSAASRVLGISRNTIYRRLQLR